MLKTHRASRTYLKYFGFSTLAVAVALALLLVGTGAWAASPEKKGPVMLMFTIPVPVAPTNTTGGMYAFDISFVDQTNQTYYLGDRSNAAVDVVDATTGTFVKQITAIAALCGGRAQRGRDRYQQQPLRPKRRRDRWSRNMALRRRRPRAACCLSAFPAARRVSERHPRPATYARGRDGLSTRRIDCFWWSNNADTPPFGTLITVGTGCQLPVGAKIVYNFATNGAEQSVWDPVTQRFYQSIPSISGTTDTPGPMGALIRINPLTATVDALFHVPFCMPAGLALDDESDLSGRLQRRLQYDRASRGLAPITNSANPLSGDHTTSTVLRVRQRRRVFGRGLVQCRRQSLVHRLLRTRRTLLTPSPATTGATLDHGSGAAILGVIDGDEPKPRPTGADV